MIILGIDPGSYFTGYGAIDVEGQKIQHLGHGVITLTKSALFADRLLELGSKLQIVFQEFSPHDVAIEKVFMGKNADSAFKLGHARGVCMYEAKRAGCEIEEYATRIVKKSITGTGAATKEHVQRFVMGCLGIKLDDRLDASDALALAIHHARNCHIQAQMKRIKVLGRAKDLRGLRV